MKHFIFFALICLVLACHLQATEVPNAIVLEGHHGIVIAADFSPDGKKVVTGGRDGTVRVWDSESGIELQNWKGRFSGSVYFVSFSLYGKKIFSGHSDNENTFRIRDTETGKILHELEGVNRRGSSTAISSDGTKIVIAQWDTVRLLDIDSGEELLKLEEPFKPHRDSGMSDKMSVVFSAVTISPDEKKIVASNGRGTRIWDIASGEEIQKLVGHVGIISTVAFSPDGKKIVSASEPNWGDRTARIWDVYSGNELLKLEGHTGGVAAAAFSPDGDRVVTVSLDRTVRIWCVDSGKQLQKFEGHSSSLYSAAFSPDGKRVVTTSWDGTARIWTLEE